jgi:MFS family permease
VLGALADRLHPRVLLVFIGLTRALTVAALGWVALGGRAPFALFVIFALLNGLLVTLTLSAGQVLVPRLVGEAALPHANSLTVMAMQGLPLVGYGVGGLLVKVLGSDKTLLMIAPLYLVMGLVAFALRQGYGNNAMSAPFHLARNLLEGWRIVRASRVLLIMLLATFALNAALNVVNVRAPIFTSRAGRGADDYALLEMLFSAGAIVGIALAGVLSRRVKLEAQMSLGYVLFALGIGALAIPHLGVWFAAQLAVGLSVGLLDVASMTRMQLLVSDGLRGRVGGTSMSAGALGLSLGAAAGGLAVPTMTLMLGLGVGLFLLSLAWVRWGKE